MKKLLFAFILGLCFLPLTEISAQVPEAGKTESSEMDDEFMKPLDDITEPRLMEERLLLNWDPVREADVFWKKIVWRVVDVREKINHHFTYPPRPMVTILVDAAMNGEIDTYSDDTFSERYTSDEIGAKLSSVDTIETFDPETYETIVEVVFNELNPDDIKRYRFKEVWFFDKETSTMKVRILGIAPLRDLVDSNGNFLGEEPMFWLYYPDSRAMLAHEKVYMVGNDATPISWEDALEMRLFNGYIFKESNIRDRRLKDYLSGVDLLMEAERIKNEIFNYEQDLWSY